MRDYRMDDPDRQCAALAARIAKELGELVADGPEIRWDLLPDAEPEGLARYFEIEYDVTHRLHAEVRIVGGRELHVDLYVDGDAELPAGLELFATTRWAPSEPVGLVLGQPRFDGPREDVGPLNADAELMGLVSRVLRGEWDRGSVTVEHPEPLLEIVPEPAILHASTLPRNTWLGAQDLSLVPFLQIAARVDEIHER